MVVYPEADVQRAQGHSGELRPSLCFYLTEWFMIQCLQFYNWVLELGGASIGHKSYIYSTRVDVPDLVHVGNYCHIAPLVSLRCASFDQTANSGFALQYIIIDDHCVVEFGACLSPGCIVRSGSTIPAMSLVTASTQQRKLSPTRVPDGGQAFVNHTTLISLLQLVCLLALLYSAFLPMATLLWLYQDHLQAPFILSWYVT